MFLFGPRWVAILPLVLLVPLVVWRRPLLIVPLLVGATIVCGPVMGFRYPLEKSGTFNGPILRVLSCNVNSGDFNIATLSTVIIELGVDIVALQEFQSDIQLKLPPGWHTLKDGELAIFSRYPIRSGRPVRGFHPPHEWPRTCLLPCIIRTPSGDIAFNTVHLPSPRYGLQYILDRKTGLNIERKDLLVTETQNRMKVSQEILSVVSSQTLPQIIAGDFNMPVESIIYNKFWSNFTNAFSKVGRGYGWSERESVRGIPINVRIDHILTGNGLKPLLCEIGKDVGSDHLPIVADLALEKQ